MYMYMHTYMYIYVLGRGLCVHVRGNSGKILAAFNCGSIMVSIIQKSSDLVSLCYVLHRDTGHGSSFHCCKLN